MNDQRSNNALLGDARRRVRELRRSFGTRRELFDWIHKIYMIEIDPAGLAPVVKKISGLSGKQGFT